MSGGYSDYWHGESKIREKRFLLTVEIESSQLHLRHSMSRVVKTGHCTKYLYFIWMETVQPVRNWELQARTRLFHRVSNELFWVSAKVSQFGDMYQDHLIIAPFIPSMLHWNHIKHRQRRRFLLPSWHGHGCGKDFFHGGGTRGFSQKLFQGAPKEVKFGFYLSKMKKQPIFAKNFKIQREAKPPPYPLPSDDHGHGLLLITSFWKLFAFHVSILSTFGTCEISLQPLYGVLRPKETHRFIYL